MISPHSPKMLSRSPPLVTFDSPNIETANPSMSHTKEWNDIRERMETKKRIKTLLRSPSHSPSNPLQITSFSPSPPPSPSLLFVSPSTLSTTFDPPSFAMNSKMKKWDELEVSMFLSAIGMEKYQEVFLISHRKQKRNCFQLTGILTGFHSK